MQFGLKPSFALKDAARLVRLLLIVCVFAGQAGAGERTVAADAQSARLQALDRAMVLCAAGHHAREHPAPVPHGLTRDIAILQSGEAPSAMLAAPPALPPRLVVLHMRRGGAAQTRAPPLVSIDCAYPRGPPFPSEA